MKRPISTVLILFTLLGAILACNTPGGGPTPDINLIVAQTQTAVAVSAALTGIASPTSPTQSSTAKVPTGSAPAGSTPAAGITPLATTPAGTTPVQPAVTNATGCTLRGKFLTETIPDGTQFAPGQQFIKTWTLQNAGDCTWTPQFSIVFVNSEQMGGTSPSPIGQTVEPNGTVQIFLPQTAPAAAGAHRGDWMLSDTSGNRFGLGGDAATSFFVKINVVPGLPVATTPVPAGISNLGPPTFAYTFGGSKSPFYIGDDSDTSYAVQDNNLVLTAFQKSGDQWRVAARSSVDNFVLEAHFHTGSACSGKDDFGLLVRAPNQADNIIDSGYVFGFSCDGSYRVYRMDNGGYNPIQEWTRHPSLHAGPNQDNVMTIQAAGEHLQLYANGTLVFEFFDSAYDSGLWGLMVGSAGTENFQVSVSAINLWDLP